MITHSCRRHPSNWKSVTKEQRYQSDAIRKRPTYGENMPTQIDEHVKMRDIETLYELMTEDDEWLTQSKATKLDIE
jgi:hypothetical protein